MHIFLNGQILPEAQAQISVLDRGFLYGDGLFETLRTANGVPFRWAQHWERLRRGADFLGIALPYSSETLRGVAGELSARNRMSDALLRLNLSRGAGGRGYSPRGADKPTLVMTLHPAPPFGAVPPGWRLITGSSRLPAGEPLAQFKTCNKLPQILPRAEPAAAGADEALLLNTQGHLVEGAASNLFWFANGYLCTPPLASGILPGITRQVVFEVASALGLAAKEAIITPEGFLQSEGAFVSLTTAGVAAVSELDGRPLPPSPLVERIGQGFQEVFQHETMKNSS
jgi:branched-chain amino acid aminotransferase